MSRTLSRVAPVTKAKSPDIWLGVDAATVAFVVDAVVGPDFKLADPGLMTGVAADLRSAGVLAVALNLAADCEKPFTKHHSWVSVNLNRLLGG